MLETTRTNLHHALHQRKIERAKLHRMNPATLEYLEQAEKLAEARHVVQVYRHRKRRLQIIHIRNWKASRLDKFHRRGFLERLVNFMGIQTR